MSFSISVRVFAMAVGLVTAGAVAGPVTVNLTGTVYPTTGFGLIPGGAAVSLSLTYDTSTLPNATPTGNQRFFAASTLNSLSFDTGSSIFSYAGSGGFQTVWNDASGVFDFYQNTWSSMSGASQGTQAVDFLSANIFGSTSILSSANTLPSAAQMSSFTSANGDLYFSSAGTGPRGVVSFKLTNIEVIDNPVIPLPGGAAMAVVGMGVIGVRRRRG